MCCDIFHIYPKYLCSYRLVCKKWYVALKSQKTYLLNRMIIDNDISILYFALKSNFFSYGSIIVVV